MSGFDVVHERLERYACVDENWCPAHDFGIAVHDRLVRNGHLICAFSAEIHRVKSSIGLESSENTRFHSQSNSAGAPGFGDGSGHCEINLIFVNGAAIK